MLVNHEGMHNLSEFDINQGTSNTKSRGRFAVHEDGKKFIFKECFDDNSTIDNNPIITAFVGFIFQLVLKGRAPDHWLVKAPNRVLIASKFLDSFNTCKSVLGDNIDINEFQDVKGIHRYLAATILLSDYDLNFGNFGVLNTDSKKVFAKIDHDYSFKTYLDSFQAFFKRLKDNTKFDFYRKLKNRDEFSDGTHIFFKTDDANNVTENEVRLEQELKSKINFSKLLKKLEDMCNIVERNQEQILSYFSKQEEILANELYGYFSRKAQQGFATVAFNQTYGLYNLQTKKFSFPLEKSLT